MSEHLLVVAIGPVQTFIAQARRTRDLWCGSWLLSELSKATALALHRAGAQLIFPAVHDAADLHPGSELSVANKVQCLVVVAERGDADAVLRGLAATAAQAARDRWRALADASLRQLGGTGVNAEVWSRQVDDYVETFAAWARVEAGSGYGDAVARAGAALAARKASRDFLPGALHGNEAPYYGRAKSSLDGARESVLPNAVPGQRQRMGHLRRKLSLQPIEQLDCAGVVKRMAGDAEQFTALSRIAADPWLRDLANSRPELLESIKHAYEPLVSLGMATRVKGNRGAYAIFPYDAALVYRGRLETVVRDARNSETDAGPALAHLLQLMQSIWRAEGEPSPYAALLLADGDRMGAMLDCARLPEHHRQATQALSRFAASVAQAVREYRGHAIYAGGDDVLAMLPLPDAIGCAERLHAAFDAELSPVATQLGATVPTLSVGLAIAHVLEPLGTIRDLAARAERVAKGDALPEAQSRNALGIVHAVRSGATRELRLHWADHAGRDALTRWQQLYAAKQLPGRIAYDAYAIAQRQRARGAPGAEDQASLEAMRCAEWSLVLSRAQTSAGGPIAPEHRAALLDRAAATDGESLANELLIARWLAAREASAIGEER